MCHPSAVGKKGSLSLAWEDQDRAWNKRASKERFPKRAKDSNSAPFQKDLVLPHWLSVLQASYRREISEYFVLFLSWKKKSGVRWGIKEGNLKEEQTALCRVSPASIPNPLADWQTAQQHCQINPVSLQCYHPSYSRTNQQWPSRNYNLNQCLSWHQPPSRMDSRMVTQSLCFSHPPPCFTSSSALCPSAQRAAPPSPRDLRAMWKKLLKDRIDMRGDKDHKRDSEFYFQKKEQCSVETKIKFN